METHGGKKAVVYVRVSTGEQALSGLGADAQESACRVTAELRGYEVVEVFRDDGVSGGIEPSRRVGMGAMLTYIRYHPGTVVLVYSISRLSRKQSHLWALLDEKGTALPVISVTETFDTTTAMGRAMLGMIAVWAQLEADLVRERTKAALAAKKARGEKLGGPFSIQIIPEVCAMIIEMVNSGKTYGEICVSLNNQGIPSARGGRWHANTVSRVVKQAQMSAKLR
jgi:site-specific DNA recombinase